MIGGKGENELAAAERFVRRRWLIVIMFTLAFAAFGLSWLLQVDYLSSPTPNRSQALRGVAWTLWGIVVLAVTYWPGWGRASPRQRAVLNDELTLAHRRSAQSAGYWILLGSLFCTLAAGFFTPVNLRLVAVVSITVGIAVPALIFGVLQHRAESDG